MLIRDFKTAKIMYITIPLMLITLLVVFLLNDCSFLNQKLCRFSKRCIPLIDTVLTDPPRSYFVKCLKREKGDEGCLYLGGNSDNNIDNMCVRSGP